MKAMESKQSNVASLPPPHDHLAAVLQPDFDSGSVPDFSIPFSSAPTLQTSPSVVFSSWQPSATVAPFLAKSLHNRWESYRGQLKACQGRFSEEAVHELRVATRRLMAQFVMLGCITPGKTADTARRILKRGLKALGELRDTHVQRVFVERQMDRFPELIFVRDFLQRQERRLERAAAAKITRFKTRKLEKWVSRLLTHLDGKNGRSSDLQRLSTIVGKTVDDAFAEVVRRRQAIDPAQPSTVHRTRIAFKKFRYMVESLSPDLTGLGKDELRALARYQKRMGMLQDLEVMQHCIKEFGEQHAGMEGLLASFNSYLQARRVRALRSFLNSADELFQFWPPPHAAHANGSRGTPGISPLREPMAKSHGAAAPPARLSALGAR